MQSRYSFYTNTTAIATENKYSLTPCYYLIAMKTNRSI